MKKALVAMVFLTTSHSAFASTYECSLRINNQNTVNQAVSVGKVKSFGRIGNSRYFGFLSIDSDGYVNADFSSNSENAQPHTDMVSISGTADLSAKDIQMDTFAFGTSANVSCNRP